jgi:hypothetical protein
MYPPGSLCVKDNKYNKRAVCITYSIWPFSSFLRVEGGLPARGGSTLSQRVAKSFVSESDVASTLPVPHPGQKWSNATRKSYLAEPQDQYRASVGSIGSYLTSKRKIYHILPPFNLLYSEQKRFSHGKVLIPHITATLTRKIVFRSGGRHENCATFVHRGPSSRSHAPVGQSNGLSMVHCLARIFFHLPSQRSTLLFFVNRAIPSQALSWSFTKQQTSVEPTTKGRSS